MRLDLYQAETGLIGKAKQILKALGKVPPISAYDSFTSLSEFGIIPAPEILAWNAAIGLRNRIVHDYMKSGIGNTTVYDPRMPGTT